MTTFLWRWQRRLNRQLATALLCYCILYGPAALRGDRELTLERCRPPACAPYAATIDNPPTTKGDTP